MYFVLATAECKTTMLCLCINYICIFSFDVKNNKLLEKLYMNLLRRSIINLPELTKTIAVAELLRNFDGISVKFSAT
jgi:hypothetical protein